MRKRGSPILGIHHIGSDRFVWKYCTPRSNGLLSLSPVNVPFEGGLHIFRLIHIYGRLSALSWCHWSWHVLTHPDVEGSRSSQFSASLCEWSRKSQVSLWCLQVRESTPAFKMWNIPVLQEKKRVLANMTKNHGKSMAPFPDSKLLVQGC